jgi:hypothetical protein
MHALRTAYVVVTRTIAVLSTFLVIAVVALRVAVPWPAPGEFTDGAQEHALSVALASNLYGRKHPVFVSFDGADPSEETLKRLQFAIPEVQIRRMSERSPVSSRCNSLPSGYIPLNGCEADDFIRVDFLAMPLWRTVLLSQTTAACHSEILLVRGMSYWHVLSNQMLCA